MTKNEQWKVTNAIYLIMSASLFMNDHVVCEVASWRKVVSCDDLGLFFWRVDLVAGGASSCDGTNMCAFT